MTLLRCRVSFINLRSFLTLQLFIFLDLIRHLSQGLQMVSSVAG